MQKRKKSIGNRPCVATYTRLFLNWIPFLRLGVLSSDMFDWNDEEIANIIWGEAGESGDHIVPFPEKGEGDENNQESSGIPAEHKLLGTKLDFQVIRPDSCPDPVKNGQISALGVDSWPNVASTQTDRGSMDDRVFNDSVLTNKYLSKEECPLDGDSGAYDNLQGKELSDFGEYDWDNIGSFDDLDRIFSNDEPLFSSVTLGVPSEIWSSSKEKTNSPSKSFDSPVMVSKSLPETSDKPKYGRGGQSLDLSFERTDDSGSLAFQPSGEMSALSGGVEEDRKHNLAVEGEARPTSSTQRAENILTLNEFADKAYGQQTHSKVQKKVRGKEKGKSSPRFESGWTPPANTAGLFKPQLSGSLSHACLSSSLSQLNPIEGPETFHSYQLIPSYMNPSAFVNYPNPIAAMGLSPRYPPSELKIQTVFPGYEVTSVNADVAGKQLDSPGKAPLMTPREKIKKLRRRQQMQAMLAIQNQLQQFGDPVSRNSIVPMNSLESPNQLKPGPTYEIDNLSALPSLDMASSIEQDESSTLSVADDGYSIEEAVLRRLQDVISKLDMPIRISIRDSLFRLAKSAVQRQQASDVNSTGTNAGEKHEAVVKEEQDASAREVKVTADAETDTNPIDRAVAHLLFHRPMELSIKHPETPESSMSAKLNMERQAQSGANDAADSGRSSKTGLDFSSSQGVGNPCQQRLMDCGDTSEPAPDYGTLVPAGTTEAGASQ
ncbi:hypothetical protein MLD38_008847 [Melastoma candidum]|uniref:Uncharacterized protein n=1 Tax=Melastoma candidum TaxID=119954 RepID=A0ACB9RVV1_9MYRT|nr:hypothetical protein MLD38_008847 [Melastoma candidum]